MNGTQGNDPSTRQAMPSKTSLLVGALSIAGRGVMGGAVCLSLAVGASRAEEASVLPVDGGSFAAQLESLSVDGVARFTSADGGREMPPGELVRWSHPKELRQKPVLITNDGSQLAGAATWRAAPLVITENAELRFTSESCGDLLIPRGSARAFVPHMPGSAKRRAQLLAKVDTERSSQDTVLLRNGDRLRGTILDAGPRAGENQLTILTDVGDVSVAFESLEAIVFGDVSRVAPSPVAKRMIVGLVDGSLVVVREHQIGPTTCRLRTIDGITLTAPGAGSVAFLQPLGGRIQYLSDMAPQSYRHVPYLEVPWSYERDSNVLGQELVFARQRYVKGIGMHSASRLSYALDGSAQRFQARAAIDAAAGDGGSVVFRVYVAKAGRWEEGYSSEIQRGGDPPQRIDVDLTGATAIALLVDYADRGDERDYANWLDARIVP